MGIMALRYHWKELAYDGKLLHVPWAPEEGYEHSEDAIAHFYNLFTIDPIRAAETGPPKYTLIKVYGNAQ